MVRSVQSRLPKYIERLAALFIGSELDRPSHLPRLMSFLLLDGIAVLVALMGSVVIASNGPALPQTWPEFAVGALVVISTLFVFVAKGLYRALIRHMGQHAVWDLIQAVTYSALIFAFLLSFAPVDLAITAPLGFWLVLFAATGGARMLLRVSYQISVRGAGKRVIIYGAGDSGRQLLHALNHGSNYNVIAFVDDASSVHNTVINGRPVLCSTLLESLVVEREVSQVLLAVPSASHERRREIINSLVGMPVHVRTVPKISELVAGRASVNQIQDVDLDDLLGRDPVPPNVELIERCITDKVVMVTGAGGSIGSELCRQILEAHPQELVLLEISEYALYKVERQLRQIARERGIKAPIVTLLGSARDERRLQSLFQTFNVNTVYHAAAYKHVPIVEHNIAEGVANNVEGTWAAARAADAAGVDTFVLVSTDKAVRPTNVMGASKRFAELILQAFAKTDSRTRFCIVRFGNVLGSSGSVVPLFREQIEQGGPVTVTHQEVSRYFMSIREAAQLVLQASAMGTGGDVFVLDMGEPVRIVDLARRMIRLSGYELEGEIQSSDHIDIAFIGLRPGEKLHEELLLGTSVSGTGHAMIMRAEEEYLTFEAIEQSYEALIDACRAIDCTAINDLLRMHVIGYEGYEPRYDFIWVKQGLHGKRARKIVEVDNVALLPTAASKANPR